MNIKKDLKSFIICKNILITNEVYKFPLAKVLILAHMNKIDKESKTLIGKLCTPKAVASKIIEICKEVPTNEKIYVGRLSNFSLFLIYLILCLLISFTS